MENSTSGPFEQPPPSLRHALAHANVLREPYVGPDPYWDIPGIRPATALHTNKKRGIGSYDATVILGLNTYKSPLALWMEMRGEIPRSRAKFGELAEVGSLMEPVLVEMYRRRTGRRLIDRAEYTKKGGRWDTRRHEKLDWMIASPDMEIEATALTDNHVLDTEGNLVKVIPAPADGAGSLELKTKEVWAEFFDDHGDPPLDVMVQVQHQLEVCGWQWGSISVLMGRRFYWVDILRNQEFIDYMLKTERDFLMAVRDGVRPAVDGSDSTSEAISARSRGRTQAEEVPEYVISDSITEALGQRFELLEGVIDEATEEIDTIKNRIKLSMEMATKATTKDGKFRFSYSLESVGKPSYVVKGEREGDELGTLMSLGAELRPGRKNGRRFLRLKNKKKKEQKNGR